MSFWLYTSIINTYAKHSNENVSVGGIHHGLELQIYMAIQIYRENKISSLSGRLQLRLQLSSHFVVIVVNKSFSST